jgi:nucleoside-diphosphate-sugar epimerase
MSFDGARAPKVCVVTGGTGFVGQRLVEMLVERGAQKVVSYDIVPKPADAWEHPAIEWIVGDICDLEHMCRVFAGADCVWHNAAAVGPFHPRDLYFKVNYQGTLNVIEACRRVGVHKIVMSSSPSTRFNWTDLDGFREDEMPKLPQKRYVQPYAETKALGEVEMLKANSAELMTIAVAPHQVYGARDNLFMPNVLEAAGTGKLRVFGSGENRICFTHVDNYCHGLIIAERALYKRSPALGRFYIVTDGDTHPDPRGFLKFWPTIDTAIVAMGFTSLYSKFKLPYLLLMALAYVCEMISWVTGKTLKLNVFNVFMLTMNRWFFIDAAERDLAYKPIVPFKDGWEDTIQWFKTHWLPTFKRSDSLIGLSTSSQAKIDIQAKGTGKRASS